MGYFDLVKFELNKIDKKKVFLFILGTIILVYFSKYYENNVIVFSEGIRPIEIYPLISELGLIRLTDVVIPIMAAISILYISLPDYNDNINEIMVLYNKNKFNKILFTRWITVLGIYFIFLVLTTLIMFIFTKVKGMNINEMMFMYSLNPIYVIVKAFPTLIWFCTFPLFILVMTKNKFASIAITAVYTVVNIFSTYYLYPFISMPNYGAQTIQSMFIVWGVEGSIRFYENALKGYYLFNRIGFTVLSLIMIIYILKKSMILKKGR